MIGVGIALLVLGVIFLFVIPWVGIPVGIIGLLLAVAWLLGFGRRAAAADEPERQSP
jgi:Flp pilus assembly protein TadB